MTSALKTCALLLMLSYSAKAQLISEKAGKLVYTPYANEGETDLVNVIPDFSSAGYAKGGVRLPFVETVVTLNPLPGDCTQQIQSAIDQVSSRPLNDLGFRGAILLKKGVYRVDGVLVIENSGVVLRGEGNDQGGTVLLALQKIKHDFITLRGKKLNLTGIKNAKRKITSAFVATGSKDFEIEPGNSFSVGDHIILQKSPNALWVTYLEMQQYNWAAEQYRIMYERTITAVRGNTITIDIPVMDPISPKYCNATIFKSPVEGRISQCGVENLRIESAFENDEDENHGWNAITLAWSENCWVKNVVAKYFGYACVNIDSMSAFNTIQDCAMIDPKSITTGSRKYSFNIGHGSTGNLIQRCVTWGGRHDYVTGARVPGPNVFLDCVAENTFADVGPHHRWATGVLFDNIYAGEIRVQNRKAMGSGHGWAGVQTLFWNCSSVKKEIKVESPIGAKNWGVGCVGLKQNGEGYWESWGTHVTPRSLYLKQLEERLGTQAVIDVTSAGQRSGVIWNKLKTWAAQLVDENKTGAP